MISWLPVLLLGGQLSAQCAPTPSQRCGAPPSPFGLRPLGSARWLVPEGRSPFAGALVARPDVDPLRLAYVGRSYGGATGALLAGIE